MDKKKKNPFIWMEPSHLVAQNLHEIESALENKKMTPEQRNLLRKLRDKQRFAAQKLYED